MDQWRSTLGGVKVNRGFWVDRRVLVTGHTGFKGAWLVCWLVARGAAVTGLALPPGATPSLWRLLDSTLAVKEVIGDVRDADVVRRAFELAEPEIVLHLAAQSLVQEGYAAPVETYDVNVTGTANVLQAACRCATLRAVLVVTSDKVYDHRCGAQPFDESSPLGGPDPYSASKASCEMVVDSFRECFLAPRGVGVGTVRAGNVIGGGDWAAARLIPDAARALCSSTPLMLRCPEGTRPWQHVLDPLHGYLQFAERLATEPHATPSALNFGPPLPSCTTVGNLVERLNSHWDGQLSCIVDAAPKHPEAPSLAISSELATKELGWSPVLDLDRAVEWTASWYLAHMRNDDMSRVTGQQIQRFEELIA